MQVRFNNRIETLVRRWYDNKSQHTTLKLPSSSSQLSSSWAQNSRGESGHGDLLGDRDHKEELLLSLPRLLSDLDPRRLESRPALHSSCRARSLSGILSKSKHMFWNGENRPEGELTLLPEKGDSLPWGFRSMLLLSDLSSLWGESPSTKICGSGGRSLPLSLEDCTGTQMLADLPSFTMRFLSFFSLEDRFCALGAMGERQSAWGESGDADDDENTSSMSSSSSVILIEGLCWDGSLIASASQLFLLNQNVTGSLKNILLLLRNLSLKVKQPHFIQSARKQTKYHDERTLS